MDYVWFPFFLLAFILIILLTRPQKKKVPPGPSKLPIIGNLPQLGDLPHRSLCDFSFKYGSLMFIKIGFLSTFVVSFAETAKEIFKTYDLHTCSRSKFISTRRFSYNFLNIAFVHIQITGES